MLESQSRLQSLTDFAKVMAAARDQHDLLGLVAAEARRALGAASVSLSIWEREHGRLRTLLNEGDLGPGEEQKPTAELYPIADDERLRALVEANVPWVVSDLGHPDPERAASWSWTEAIIDRYGKGSGLGVPLVIEGRVWGELYATRHRHEVPFGPADLDFAVAVAAQAAAGIAQAEHVALMSRLAFTDPLTGLANRRALESHLDSAVERADDDVTLIVADLNGLKRVNDEWGHEAGDAALVAMAQLLSTEGGSIPGTLAARLGGDEFCLVLVGVDIEHALELADTICAKARGVVELGVSCGIASTSLLPSALRTPTRLFRLADAAQYRAKRLGSSVPMVAGRGTEQLMAGAGPVADGAGSAGIGGMGGMGGVGMMRPAGPGGRRRFRDPVAPDLARLLDVISRAVDENRLGDPLTR